MRFPDDHFESKHVPETCCCCAFPMVYSCLRRAIAACADLVNELKMHSYIWKESCLGCSIVSVDVCHRMCTDLFEGKTAIPCDKIGCLIDVVEIRWNFDNVSPSHDPSSMSELLKENLKTFVIKSKVVIERRFGCHFE
jgi:hypothetical protein